MDDEQAFGDPCLDRFVDTLLPYWPQIGVALMADSLFIMGFIVSEAEYLSLIVDQIGDAVTAVQVAGIPAVKPPRDDSTTKEVSSELFHLRDVMIIAPNGHALWSSTFKVHRKAVKGWTLGEPTLKPVA